MSNWIRVVLVRILFVAALLGGFARAADGSDAEQLFQLAGRLQNQGKIADALDKWRTFLSSYPNDPSAGQAFGGLGTCLLETGEFSKAIAAFDQALKRLPSSEKGEGLHWNRAVASYRRAEQSKQESHWLMAAETLDAIAEDATAAKDHRALAAFYRAKVDQGQSKNEAAKQRFQQLLTAAPEPSVVPHALLALAGLAEAAKDWPVAGRWYRQFLREHSQHHSTDDARLGLADVLLESRQYPEAEALYGELQQRKGWTSAPYAQFRWGEAAFLRGDTRTAAERLTVFLEQNPKSAYLESACLLVGNAYFREKEYAKAAQSFERFLHEFPKSSNRPLAFVRLAQALLETGDAAGAETKAKEILEQLKEGELLRDALLLLARTAAKAHRPADALKRYQECFQLQIKLEEPEQVRCEAIAVAFAAGESDRGLKWANELVNHAPKSPCASQAQLHAARWLAEKGKFDESLARTQWVLEAKSPASQPLALYLSGFCCMKLRKFDDAVKHYGNLLEQYPQFEQAAAAWFSLGAAHESLAAKSKAIESYRKLRANYPNDPLAAKAEARLKSLEADN